MARNIFLNEVSQQASVISNVKDYAASKEGLVKIARWNELTSKHREVVCLGMGTNSFATELIVPYMNNKGICLRSVSASLFFRDFHSLRKDVLYVLISQSGESYETKLSGELLQREEIPAENIVSIVNNVESSTAKMAGLVFPMLSGDERSISTKTYVATLAWLAILSGADEHVYENIGKVVDILRKNPPMEEIRHIASKVCNLAFLPMIGQGVPLAGIKQFALTMHEGPRMPACAYERGDFRHGPFELIQKGVTCFVFVPKGHNEKSLRDMAFDIAAHGAQAIVFTDSDDNFDNPNITTLRFENIDSEYSEMYFNLAFSVIQGHLLDEICVARGIDTGTFRYGSKITTKA